MSLQERSNYTISNTSNSLITGSATIGNINTTGITTGNLNFTGNLFQNGTAYVASSQWTSTSGNISYTSGSVIIGNTSGNVALRASSSSGSYNFNLPIDSGSAGQLLVSGGGGTAPTYWGTSVVPACLSRTHTTSQTINNNSGTTIFFDTLDNNISVGVTGLSYSAGVFTNTTSTTLTFEVNVTFSFSWNTAGTRVAWISASNSSLRIGNTEVAANQNSGSGTTMNINGIITLPANGTFQIITFQNSGSNLTTAAINTSPTVISITSINSGFIVPGNGGSLLARYAASNQSIPNNTITIVAFDTLDSVNSTGFTGFTYSSGTFTNSTTSPITINVNAYIAWPSNLSTSVWILTSTSSRRIGFSSATNNYQLINGTCTIPASGTFAIYAFQSSGGAVNLYQDGTSQTSIQITPISGYSGNINATGITTSNLVVNGTTRITATTGSTAIFQNSVNYGSVLEINSTATNGRNFKIQSTASADGLNSEGAFVIDDATSSLRRFVIGSSGNVGINTATPATRLDVTGSGRFVNSTSNTFASLTVGGPNANGTVPALQTTGSTVLIYNDSPGPGVITNVDLSVFHPSLSSGIPSTRISLLDLGLANNSFNLLTRTPNNVGTSMASRIFIDGSGSVGINTTSPGETLSVNGPIRTIGSTGILNFWNAAQSTRFGYLYHSGTNGNIELNNQLTGDIFFSTNNSEKMRIGSSGNVGINTVTPSFRLDVNGTSRITSSGSGQSNGTLLLTGSDFYGHTLYIAGSSNTNKRIGFNHNGSVGNIWAYDYSGSVVQNLCLQFPGGSVGVGTTAPGYTLDVIGTFRATSSATNGFTFTDGTTRLDISSGRRGGSTVAGWTNLDPNGGGSTGIYIYDGLHLDSASTTTLGSTLITSTLDVNGTIKSTNTKFNARGPNSPTSYSAGQELIYNQNIIASGQYNTSTGRFTANIAGTYMISMSAYISGASGTGSFTLRKNGSGGTVYGYQGDGSGVASTFFTITTIVDMAVNDYVSGFVGTGNIRVDFNTIFCGFLIV